MPPQHLSPVVTAGFHIVLLDQVPDDLLQRDSSCREMQARERSLVCISSRRGEHVEMAARIWHRSISVVLVCKQRTRVVHVMPGLVGIRDATGDEVRRRCVTRPKCELKVQVHPIAELHRLPTA